MYYVVLWDHYCQIVPHCWLNFKEKTFTHPPSRHNITNAIKKKMYPANDWKVCNFHKMLGPYDTYDKARDAEKSCINVSTSDDLQLAALNKPVQTLPAKRLITKRKFYDDSDSNDMHDCKFDFNTSNKLL